MAVWNPRRFMIDWNCATTAEDRKKQLKYVASSNKVIVFNDRGNISIPTTIITSKIRLSDIAHVNISSMQINQGHIELFDGTTDDAIIRYHDGNRMCVLNFANSSHPGGGYFSGSIAQEEELCRQYPFLHASLKESNLYPIEFSSCLYTKDIPRNRENRENGYEFIINPQIVVDFISAAAPNMKGRQKNMTFDNLKKRIEETLDIIFISSTYLTGYQTSTLIIGAWGCGAFAPEIHDDKEVYLNKMILSILGKTVQYSKLYDKIVVAIPLSINKNIYELFYHKMRQYGII